MPQLAGAGPTGLRQLRADRQEFRHREPGAHREGQRRADRFTDATSNSSDFGVSCAKPGPGVSSDKKKTSDVRGGSLEAMRFYMYAAICRRSRYQKSI